MRYKLLEAMRLTAIIQGVQDKRFLAPDLTWLKRTPVISRDAADILAGFSGDVFVAELLTDDAEAITKTEGVGKMKTHTIPNMKHGFKMDQGKTNELYELSASGAAAGTKYANFVRYLTEKAAELLEGVRQRMDILCLQMRLDALNYNRLGVILQNVTWGMPALLKANSAIFWSDTVNATPITDMETYLRNAQDYYGITFRRITMSTKALQFAVNSQEFKDRLGLIFNPLGVQNVSMLPYGNMPYMVDLLQRVLSNVTGNNANQPAPLIFELDDRRFKQQNGDGSVSYIRPFPADHILFDDPIFDNNVGAMRFANAVVTETIISSVADGGMIGKFRAPMEGPVSYAIANPTYNPAGLAIWAVARGFPEKVQAIVTGRLRVGYFADGIVRQPDIF